jgi:hypothetical protein
LGGRVEVEVVGVDETEGAGAALMRDAAGVEHRIPLADVKEARLVFRWNR